MTEAFLLSFTLIIESPLIFFLKLLRYFISLRFVINFSKSTRETHGNEIALSGIVVSEFSNLELYLTLL